MSAVRATAVAAAAVLVLAAGAAPRATGADDLELQPGTKVVFATRDETKKLLTEKDAFVSALSPFDRAARLKTDRDVSEKEYLEFVAAQALDWTDADRKAAAGVVAQLAKDVAPFKLALPAVIRLAKTTGLEEGAAAYCRGSTIVIPKNMLDRAGMLGSVLPHELFHVYSTHNRERRAALYKVVGFTTGTTAVTLPPGLAQRKITNPDAPDLDVTIAVKRGAETVTAVPVLYSRSEKYDTAKGGAFFDYLEFRLLVVVKRDGGKLEASTDDKGAPVLLKTDETDYLEQVGKNTGYTIHPDEILADNFVLLLTEKRRSRKPPTPAILEGLRKALADAATK